MLITSKSLPFLELSTNIFLTSLSIGFITFLTFIDKSFISLNDQNLQLLLICNVVLLIIFFLIIFFEIKNSLSKNINTSDISSHRKYIAFFAFFTLIPSLLISIFSLFLFSFGIEKYFLTTNESTSIDSIYTHDPFVITNNGAVLCNMGKVNRVSEIKAFKEFLIEMEIPILGEITSPGKLEGGDIVWINKRTIAIGIGYRTNKEGVKQLKQILSNTVNQIIPVPLPHWRGPNDCLHLISNLSPVDDDLFLIYSRLLPVQFLEELQRYNIELIDVPDKEYYTMGCNVLAVSPRKVIMLKGNPLTKKMLETKNVEVHTYKGSEISLKGSGGPTCLTKPFLRSSENI